MGVGGLDFDLKVTSGLLREIDRSSYVIVLGAGLYWKRHCTGSGTVLGAALYSERHCTWSGTVCTKSEIVLGARDFHI
jgi:hypothetical protein